MSGVQVLDLGDLVNRPLASIDDRTGVIIGIQDNYTLAVLSGQQPRMVWRGIARSDLQRIGGDLQVGDFVRVEGEVRAPGVGEWSTVSWDTALITGFGWEETCYIAPLHRTSQYQTRLAALTRITKAEARS